MPGPIAICDDDATVLGLLQDVLESEGFAVIACRSPLELHQAAIRGATLAITDSWGAGRRTLDQAEREQIMALARLVPTVLASGRAWAVEASAAELGLAALLPKPFDLQALLDLVRARQRSHDHAWSPPPRAESLRL